MEPERESRIDTCVECCIRDRDFSEKVYRTSLMNLLIDVCLFVVSLVVTFSTYFIKPLIYIGSVSVIGHGFPFDWFDESTTVIASRSPLAITTLNLMGFVADIVFWFIVVLLIFVVGRKNSVLNLKDRNL